jgi:hypothetical protein
MSFRFKIVIVFFVGCFISYQSIAQQDGFRFIETEYSVGKIVPNYTKIFPTTSFQQSLTLSFGKQNFDTTNWGKYYRFPETGLSLFASNLGNNKVYGNQFSVLPFIRFQLFNQTKPLYLKLALGVTYFTTHYDSITNKENLSNGSPFTWGFQAMLYKTIYQKNDFNLKLVGGYSHHSNGHTQIPNFGLNSALFGVSAQWLKADKKKPLKGSMLDTKPELKLKRYFISFREGVGFHELGATYSPIGGDKKMVYTTSLSLGVLFNNHIKWKAGFAHRYYQHYYDYIKENNLTQFNNNAEWSASNIYFFTSVEFLMSHVAIDVEGGLNMYKPFYKKFNDDFQKDKGFNYELKRWLNARMGLNYYLVNTLNTPTHNIYFGAHINANFGQADFTEFSFGYVYSLP